MKTNEAIALAVSAIFALWISRYLYYLLDATSKSPTKRNLMYPTPGCVTLAMAIWATIGAGVLVYTVIANVLGLFFG
jgi:hypothetical protein